MATIGKLYVDLEVKVVGCGSRRRLKILAFVAKLLGINLEVVVNG